MAIEYGTAGQLPWAAVGSGPPLAVFAGLGPMTGVGDDRAARGMLGPAKELTDSHRVVLFNRRPHLPRGMTMAAMATEHATALRELFGGPVDVLGTSTGGSIAQQVAADHPDAVSRLVLVSTACRLGPGGRDLQRRVAARIRAGAHGQALAVMAAGLVPPGRGQVAAGVAARLLGSRIVGDPADLDDAATTIEAEDGFDLAACSAPIRAHTLVLAGQDDRFYTPELFEETARLIPGSELRLFPGRGHITVTRDRDFKRVLEGFLR